MNLGTLVDRLDDRLDTAGYADIDGSPNGLQVGQRDTDVERVVFAVDAARATFERAIDADADLMVTHHGLWWKGTQRMTGPTYDRVAMLIEHDIALYVSHLPLDGHQELGNAAGVAQAIDLEDREPFGSIGDRPVGQRGRVPSTTSIDGLVERVDERVIDTDRDARVLSFGPTQIDDVAIVTGAGDDFIDEAISTGVDAFITGEGKQRLYHECKEAELTLVLAGHYQTETFGVRSLATLADEWGLETVFVDHPTGF